MRLYTKIRELARKEGGRDAEGIKKIGRKVKALREEIENIRAEQTHKCAKDVQIQCYNLGRPRLDTWLKHGIDKCKRIDDSLNKAESATCARLFKDFQKCVGSRVELASPDYTLDTLLLQLNAPPIFIPRINNLGITNLNKFINSNFSQNEKLWKKPLLRDRESIVVLWDKISRSMKLYLFALSGCVSITDFKLVEKFNPMIITATILGFEGRFIKLGLPFFSTQAQASAGIPQFHPWNPRGIDNRTATHEYAYDEEYYIDKDGKIKIKKSAVLSPIQKEWGVMPTGHRNILLITYEAFVEALRLGAQIKARELINKLQQTESTKEAGGEIKMAEVGLLPLPPTEAIGFCAKYLGGVTLKEKSTTNKPFDNLQKRFNALPEDYDFIPGKIVEILLLPAAKQKWVKAKLIKNIGKSPHGGEVYWVAEYKKNGQDIQMRVRESRIRVRTTETSEKVGSTGGRRKKKRTRKKKKKRRRKRKTRKKRRKTKKKRR